MINYLVDVTALICNKRICYFVAVFLYKLFFKLCRIFGFCQFFPIKNRYRSVRTHYCYFGSRPCEAEVASQVLAVHYNKGSTISFPQNDCNLRNSGFAVCKEHFCAVADNAGMLLVNTWEKPGYISKGQDWDIKGITEPYKSCTFCR